MGLLDFNLLRRSVGDLAQQVRELRSSIETLKKRRDDVANAPPHRSDVKACYERVYGMRQKQFRSNLTNHLMVAQRNGGRFLHNDEAAFASLRALAIGHGTNAADTRSIDDALCALLGDAIMASLFRVIDELPWPTEGLPMAERKIQLAELDAELDKMVSKEQSLMQTAREVGITIA